MTTAEKQKLWIWAVGGGLAEAADLTDGGGKVEKVRL